jgi:hypothetical protein
MDEMGSTPEPQAANAASPLQTPAAAKPPARRFSVFLAIAVLVLFAGTILLTVQWLRTRAMLQESVVEIARDVAALKNQIEDLGARVTTLEKSSAEAQSASGQVADLNTRLAAVEADVLRNADRDALAQLQGRIARLENASPGEMFRTAAATLARANLARAAEGAAPLNGELNALRAAAPDDPALAIIEPMAQTGAPTRTILTARFAVAARAALAAERAGSTDDNFFARLWTSLRGLVRVRRVSDVAGTTTEDRLARAQADCDRGDLAGAAMETRSVSGRATLPLQSWLKDADARLALDGAVADMNLRFGRASEAPAGAPP